MPKLRCRLPILMPLALAACAMLPKPADPQIVSLADAIHHQASIFYAGLAGKLAPECAFAANSAGYDRLVTRATELKNHISGNRASPALVRASEALERTIVDARASHEAASARSDDTFGLCLAPGALALNADAIARAGAALSSTQNRAGDQ